MSVQVHPDDEYALKHEGEYGKTECWYILDAQPGAEIIYGVNATSKNELEHMIDHHQLTIYLNMYLLNRVISFMYQPVQFMLLVPESSFWKLNNLQIQHIVYTIMTEKIKMVIRVNYI